MYVCGLCRKMKRHHPMWIGWQQRPLPNPSEPLVGRAAVDGTAGVQAPRRWKAHRVSGRWVPPGVSSTPRHVRVAFQKHLKPGRLIRSLFQRDAAIVQRKKSSTGERKPYVVHVCVISQSPTTPACMFCFFYNFFF